MSKFEPRDLSIPAEEQGLFEKFIVQRVDGSDKPGGKHEGCRYFVLDMAHDVHAAPALLAYADSCEKTHPELAFDLRVENGGKIDLTCCPSNEMTDIFGVKPNGETVLLGQAPITPTMKAKQLIQEMIGYGNFDDEDSDHSMMLYAFEQFERWLKQRGHK